MSITKSVMEVLADCAGAQYCLLKYRAKGTGELAKFFCVLGANVEELYKADIVALNAMLPNLTGLAAKAAMELLMSRAESLAVGIGNNSQYTQADVWESVAGLPGVRVHKEGGQVQMAVLVEDRTVLEAGTYKEVNSTPKTLAKNEIRKQLPSGKYRTFLLDHIHSAHIAGKHLEATVAEINAADEDVLV